MSIIEPEANMYDLFVIDASKHPEHWRAWRDWYLTALGRSFFPDIATVLFAWPPMTGEQVVAVLLWLQKLQDELRSDAKAKRLPPPKLAPIPKIAPVYAKQSPRLRHLSVVE